MMAGFSPIVAYTLAYRQGERFSKAVNVDTSDRFAMGGMNVADAMGFERDSIEWQGAMMGAMHHIEALQELHNVTYI